MSARLYVTPLSNPSKAAIAMVAYKQLPHTVVTLTSGFHPYLVRAARFQGRTVPALRLDDGRRVQGSLAISRTLDELIAERPLFPADPGARRAVEDAERWGNDELQAVPRRMFRYATVQDRSLRRWIAADVAKVPAPALAAALTKPLAARRSREVGGEDLIRADVVRLPTLLDHVDALVAGAVIGTGPAQRRRLPGPLQRSRAARLQGAAGRSSSARARRRRGGSSPPGRARCPTSTSRGAHPG